MAVFDAFQQIRRGEIHDAVLRRIAQRLQQSGRDQRRNVAHLAGARRSRRFNSHPQIAPDYWAAEPVELKPIIIFDNKKAGHLAAAGP